MNLLKYTPQIISSSTNIIEKRQKESMIYLKIQKRIHARTISIIIRKAGTVPYIFYSVWAE